MKRLNLARALAASLAVGVGGTANAAIPPAPAAVADAYLLIDNFQIRLGNLAAGVSPTPLPIRSLPAGTDQAIVDLIPPGGVIDVTRIVTTANVAASVDGAADTTANLGAGVGLAVPFSLSVEQGDAGFMPEVTLPGDPTSTFAGSFTSSTGNALLGFDTVPVHNQASIADYGRSGEADANQDLTSDFDFTIAGDPLPFEVTFDATAYLRAALGQDGNATANMSWTATLTDRDTQTVLMAWSPNGINLNGLGLDGPCSLLVFPAIGACNEFSDPFSLNQNGLVRVVSEGEQVFDSEALVDDDTNNIDNAFFEMEMILSSGNYTFGIAHSTDVNASVDRAIPEPGTLALMGLGMMGLGAARRKAKK